MKAVLEVLNLIKKDKYIKYSVIIILFLCIVHSLILGYASGLIVLLWYILGYAISFILIEYQPYVVAYLEKLVSVYNNRSSIREKIKSSCSVCDDLTCKRHQITKDLRPWKIIQISDELNEAIIHFYERILNTFVSSWYNQFTDSKDFPNELRFCLKYASATLINRFFQIDYINVITNKLVPQAIKHIDDYLYMQQIAKLKNVKFNDVVVEYLGKKLHPAITNRKNELEYLQHLSSELIKQLLPEHYIKCKNYSVLLREILAGWVLLPLMDVLADPNIINHLVIIATNYRPGKSSKVLSTANNVEFLENFIAVDDNSTSSLAINLNKIKNNVELLYAFMQFLKKEEQVHILQFCLDVDDFNTKLLTPDLTKKQLEDLHSQAISLYKEYLSEDSISFIGCSKEICDQFNGLIKDIYSVAQLRTSKPLYQAYEYAFNYLESIWLPHFFHSNEFYNYICGSKVSATYHKASIKTKLIGFGSPIKDRSKKYYEQSNYSAVSKISSSFGKIKGVLKTQIPVEGSLDSLEAIENGISEDLILNENLIRDLSSWKVTIPTSEVTPNKVTYFCLNVLHVDNSTPDHKINNWIVWRKDQDFFTLKSKLVEFHGEDEICDSPLPSRKAGSAIESRMAKYEDFIMKLLQKPSLRGSDLLHTFLTHDEDFTLVISTLAATNQDIGNIYQSVAYKLRKEKGQHLDSFMATFFNSIAKQKPDKIDLAEEGLEMHSGINQVTPKTFHSNIFKDNFGVSYRQCLDSSSSSFSPVLFSECLFYLFKNIFKVPIVFLKLYVAVCSVAQQLIDLFSKIIIEKKLKTALCQSNLAFLIGLLEGVIFDHRPTHTQQEYEERKIKAFKDINFCPKYLERIFGSPINEGLTTILEILQNPHYNKQLAYNLIDIVLLEMFPELAGQN